FTKAGMEGFERYIALYHTRQEHGGCKGCRFFLMCKGQCPGTAIDGDWRNRTEHCDVWKTLYRHLEEQMLDRGLCPISDRAEREWLAGLSDVRRCAVTLVTAEDVVPKSGQWLKRGLSMLPLEMEGTSGHSYANASRQPRVGEPLVFRILVGRPADVEEFKRCWDTGDNRGLGRLLGYPPCCLDFFEAIWVDQGLVDTTWPMARATAEPKNGTNRIDVLGPPEGNILWRWMGARAVPHLPCRFDCGETVALATRFLDLGRAEGC